METTTNENDNQQIISTVDGETALFRSIIRYRPRGYNRHFSMIGICKDLEKELHVVIPSHQIWNSLRSCYNLDLLAEMEPDDPDEIDRTKSTVELLCSKQTFFKEFQLPIHPTTPPEMSFLKLVNERRLETSSNPSSPDQPNNTTINSPHTRRTTINSSLKLHLDQRSETASKDGVESDLTEQEDYEEEEEEDDDDDSIQKVKDEDDNEDEEEDSNPEPKIKKLKTSNQRIESNSTTTTATHSNRSRDNNNNTNAHLNSTSSNNKPSLNNINSLARSNRSRNRTR